MTRPVAALAGFGVGNQPDFRSRPFSGGIVQPAVGRDQRRSLDFCTGETETIANRVVDPEGNSRGVGNEVRSQSQGDDIVQTREFLKVGF